MNPTRLALATAAALLCSHVLVAQVSTAAGITRHVAARSFVLVVKADGSVVGWGREEDGMGARQRSPKGVIEAPVVIDLPAKALQVAVGDLAAYALLEEGAVVAWGANADGQLGNGAMGANGELGRYPHPAVPPGRG